MMKKCFALLAACLLLISVFAGCGKKKNDKSGLQADDSVAPTFERVASLDAAGNAQTVSGAPIYDCYTFESIDSETVMITGFYSETKGKTAAASEETQSYVKCLDQHTVCIPEKLAGKTVAKIGEYAFKQHTEIKNIVLPATLTFIGKFAFDECSNLQSVALPASVAELGIAAFRACTSLTSVTFAAEQGLTFLPQQAFSGCTALQSLQIPGYIKSIGEGAFLNCTAITTLTLNEGLETIGNQAFQNSNLTVVPALPSTVTTVGALNPWPEKG